MGNEIGFCNKFGSDKLDKPNKNNSNKQLKTSNLSQRNQLLKDNDEINNSINSMNQESFIKVSKKEYDGMKAEIETLKKSIQLQDKDQLQQNKDKVNNQEENYETKTQELQIDINKIRTCSSKSGKEDVSNQENNNSETNQSKFKPTQDVISDSGIIRTPVKDDNNTNNESQNNNIIQEIIKQSDLIPDKSISEEISICNEEAFNNLPGFEDNFFKEYLDKAKIVQWNNITDKTNQTYQKIKAQYKNITKFDFHIEEDEYQAKFLSMLCLMPEVKHMTLILNDLQMDQEKLTQIIDYMSNMEKIEVFKIDISTNYYDSQFVEDLFELISKQKALKTLKFKTTYTDFQLADDEVQKIKKMLITVKEHLEDIEFEFFQQNISEKGVEDLVQGIIECKKIKNLKLDFYKNPIKYEGAVTIFKGFENWNNLESFDLNLHCNPGVWKIQQNQVTELFNNIKCTENQFMPNLKDFCIGFNNHKFTKNNVEEVMKKISDLLNENNEVQGTCSFGNILKNERPDLQKIWQERFVKDLIFA